MKQRVKPGARGSLESGGAETGGTKKQVKRSCTGKLICSLFLAAVLGGIAHIAYDVATGDCIIDPAIKDVPPAMPFTGPMAVDAAESMADAELMFPELWRGTECFAWDADGNLYTGTMNGEIWKLPPSSNEPVLVARTGKEVCDVSVPGQHRRCGRPLGIHWMADNTLLVADGYIGLLRVSLSDGAITTLLSYGQVIDGKPIMFPDDLAVGPDGSVYFSDVSYRYDYDQFLYDILESRPLGRIIRYNPQTGEARTFADELYFPNGIELSPDKASIVVCETSYFRLKRLYIDERIGQSEIVVDSLPGFPDNVRRHPSGGYLVGLSAGRTLTTDLGNHQLWLRRFLAKYVPYEELTKISVPYGLCVHISEEGEILRSWHDPQAKTVGHTAHCEIRGQHMYIGSFKYPGMGKLKLNDAMPPNIDH